MCQGRKHINGIGFEVCFVILRHREILLAIYVYYIYILHETRNFSYVIILFFDERQIRNAYIYYTHKDTRAHVKCMHTCMCCTCIYAYNMYLCICIRIDFS